MYLQNFYLFMCLFITNNINIIIVILLLVLPSLEIPF